MKRFINKIFKQSKNRKLAAGMMLLILISIIFLKISMETAQAACGCVMIGDDSVCTDSITGELCYLSSQEEANSIAQTAANGLDPIRAIINWAEGLLVGNFIYYAILTPLSWLLGIAGTFAEWMLQPAYIVNSTVVQIGWGVTRDLANMFFILILLGIALDYILFQSFGVKHALPMLIVVALLINFSLPIAGIFIDFANVFSNFFISKITGDCLNLNVENCGFTMAIAQNLNLTKLYETGGAANLIVNMIFAALLMLGIAFTLFALGIMFLLRTGWLYALLILLPLVLVLMPFPKTSQYFGRWTNKFFQWTMFAPVAMFFLYLSMLVFQANINPGETNNIKTMSYLVNGAQAQVWNQGVCGAFIEQVIKYVVVWFFMLGSLMAAQSMSITGAGAALGMIKSAEKWAGGKVKNAGKRGLSAAGRVVGADKKMEDLARGLQKIPGIGGALSSSVRGVASKTKTAMEKQEALTAKEKANFEGLSDEALRDEYKTYRESSIPGNKAKANNIALMLSQRKGNALTEKNPDGSVNGPETTKLRKAAYDNAKAHNNKTVMEVLAEKDPMVKRYAIDQKYAGKAATVIVDGKTKQQAEDDYYKHIKPKDIIELPDSYWGTKDGEDLIGEMMKLKSLTGSHLQAAFDDNKLDFITGVEKYIKSSKVPDNLGSKGPPATGLWAPTQHPGLARFLAENPGGQVIAAQMGLGYK